MQLTLPVFVMASSRVLVPSDLLHQTSANHHWKYTFKSNQLGQMDVNQYHRNMKTPSHHSDILAHSTEFFALISTKHLLLIIFMQDWTMSTTVILGFVCEQHLCAYFSIKASTEEGNTPRPHIERTTSFSHHSVSVLRFGFFLLLSLVNLNWSVCHSDLPYLQMFGNS